MSDKIAGRLEVGTNDRKEVVVNHPKIDVDKDGCGHIVFSPGQARSLGLILFKKAREAEAPDWSGHDDIAKATTDDIFGLFSSILYRIVERIESGETKGIGEEAAAVKFDDILGLVRAALSKTQPVCEHTFEEAVKFVVAHLQLRGKTYVEIAVDHKTNKIAWSFKATLRQSAS